MTYHHASLIAQRVVSLVVFLSTINLVRSLSGVGSKQRTWFNQNSVDSFSAHKITPHLSSYNAFQHLIKNGTAECKMNRTEPPVLEDLVGCQNSSMFNLWRPKARFIGPRGWMNDPMGIFQTKTGEFHIGYQCSPYHLGWANISQCSASTTDFVRFNDYRGWQDPVTLYPSQIYDIRGILDGVVIKDGWNGHPSLLYTSVYVGEFGPRSDPPEVEGVETQSIAYTEDDGKTWTKLNFGSEGNPVIYYWPEKNLTGFRDPFVFESEEFSNFYANTSIPHHLPKGSNARKPLGPKYLLLSGGVRAEADPINGGPRLFLYRQTEENDIRHWTYLGSILSFPAEYNQTSEWTGGNGINFEGGAFCVIDEKGSARDPDSSDITNRLNIFTIGTEGARHTSHMDSWPIWHAVSWNYDAPDGNVKARVDFSGVIDWGRAYGFVPFTAGNRQLLVGWTYEDDEFNVLTSQRGAQGAFTLFREMFVKVIRNIHPDALRVPEHAPSWTIKDELDGSHSLITLGQSILPEIKEAFQKHSKVTKFEGRIVDVEPTTSTTEFEAGDVPANLIDLEEQPTDRFYAIKAQLDFFPEENTGVDQPLDRPPTLRGGFRILSSKHEWTDIYYDPNGEYLVVDRSNSSAVPSYGNYTERAKHRLWPIVNPATKLTSYESLNLTIVVDNSVLEVHANDCTIITTRVYPWYEDSIGVKYLVQDSQGVVDKGKRQVTPQTVDASKSVGDNSMPARRRKSVRFSNVELWDGLLNAWPSRPYDTSLPGLYSHNITSTVFGLWPDV